MSKHFLFCNITAPPGSFHSPTSPYTGEAFGRSFSTSRKNKKHPCLLKRQRRKPLRYHSFCRVMRPLKLCDITVAPGSAYLVGAVKPPAPRGYSPVFPLRPRTKTDGSLCSFHGLLCLIHAFLRHNTIHIIRKAQICQPFLLAFPCYISGRHTEKSMICYRYDKKYWRSLTVKDKL